jgi:hypothetical protein
MIASVIVYGDLNRTLMETLEIQETKTRMPLGIIGKLKTNLILIGLRVVERVRAWRVMTTVLDADGKPVLVGLTAAYG